MSSSPPGEGTDELFALGGDNHASPGMRPRVLRSDNACCARELRELRELRVKYRIMRRLDDG